MIDFGQTVLPIITVCIGTPDNRRTAAFLVWGHRLLLVQQCHDIQPPLCLVQQESPLLYCSSLQSVVFRNCQNRTEQISIFGTHMDVNPLQTLAGLFSQTWATLGSLLASLSHLCMFLFCAYYESIPR